MLNLIRQTLNPAIVKSVKSAINQIFNPRFKQDCQKPIMEFQHSTSNKIWEIISEKDWKPEKIGFFD